MSKYLLFLAYTKQQVAECRYFLIKYLALYNLKPPTDTTAVIYTSDPVSFENFGIFFKHFELQDVANDTFTRTAALHHFFQQHNGAVLFCDTATYPLQPLEHLFADIETGALYLHSQKRYPENELAKAMRRFTNLRDKTATVIAMLSPSRTNVGHAAVVGLNGQHQELVTKLLHEESIASTPLALDYSYTKTFSEAGTIKSAAKYIYEYSSLAEFSQLLETFFKKNEEESIPNQIKLLHHIDAAAIQQQKEHYLQQPLFKKWLQIITGKKWTIKQYENRF